MKSKAEAMEIFSREAVLFGSRDGIPLYRASELVGQEAANYVFGHFQNDTKSGVINGYGIGDYTAFYLTLTGWLMACTYLNVREIQKLDESR